MDNYLSLSSILNPEEDELMVEPSDLAVNISKKAIISITASHLDPVYLSRKDTIELIEYLQNQVNNGMH